MKINQVEQLVGITKGNIRFYEKEGLLTPGRNNENGYRDYVCAQIRDSRSQLDALDADGVLESMERQEQEGTKFMNVGKQDKLTRYVSPVGAAVVVLAMMAAFIALIVWGFTVSPEDAPPIGVIIGLAVIPVVVIIGVLAALYQRIKQIRGGEEDAAAQY
ncbi:MAG: MerR family transcriptional regulator [Oscillospiraceae bacterium]|nr:MerR family transcriptional regulator [Oscillospiraceae bacterium]